MSHLKVQIIILYIKIFEVFVNITNYQLIPCTANFMISKAGLAWRTLLGPLFSSSISYE